MKRELPAGKLQPGDRIVDAFGGPGHEVIDVTSRPDGRVDVAVRHVVTFDADQPIYLASRSS